MGLRIGRRGSNVAPLGNSCWRCKTPICPISVSVPAGAGGLVLRRGPTGWRWTQPLGACLLSQAWKRTDPQSCSHAAPASGAGEGDGAGGCEGTALHPQQLSLTARGLQPLLPPASVPLEALSPFRPGSCPLGGGVHQASSSALGLDPLRLSGGTHVISCP